MKLLKRRLLFVLGSDVDVFETVEAFSYWRYSMVYWRVGEFASVSVRVAMNDLIKNGLVARIVRDGEPRFRLTAGGRDRLLTLWPVAKARWRWDRTWRVLVLDRGALDQAHQRKLRLILEDLGFVPLAAGVFVSPQAASEEVKKQLMEANLDGAVTMVETKRFVVGDDRAFASRIWRLDELVERQRQLISRSDKLLNVVRRAKTLTDQHKLVYNKVNFEWFRLLLEVPGLPLKLLPSDWPHPEARTAMVKLGGAVRELEEEA